MSDSVEITLLGTGSAQPTVYRNHSSLAINISPYVWLVDCGEATQHQILKCPKVKLGRIRKLFITHLHGDHTFGIAGLLCTLSAQFHPETEDSVTTIELYGPKGLREYVRAVLTFSYSTFGGAKYIVHELHFKNEASNINIGTPHASELLGRNLIQNDDGLWMNICQEGDWCVHAGPLVHTVPCVGYVFQENNTVGKLNIELVKPLIEKHFDALKEQIGENPMSLIKNLKQLNGFINFPDGTTIRSNQVLSSDKIGRKIVVLGDTCDSSGISRIAQDADFVVHEATQSFVASTDSEITTEELVTQKVMLHGHSTARMAGCFAQSVNAKRLILRHFSSRYSGDSDEASLKIMNEIAFQAKEEYKIGHVEIASDLSSYSINRPVLS